MIARVIQGDCIERLREMPDDSIDAIVTDPPYELGFMGKSWDSTGIANSVELWAEALRVLKPGGHLAAFGGTRTYHRMTCAIEDAGFEIRDSLHWIYGTGFPKSLSISKTIDKRRTEDVEPVRVVCRAIRRAMDAKGVKSKDLTQYFGDCHPRMVDHWAARDTDSQPCLPTPEQWATLRRVLSIPCEFGLDDEVRRLNDRKGDAGDDWTGAEVTGEHTNQIPGIGGHRFTSRDSLIREPTDAAAQWGGWGTALKPAHEPIVLARKPVVGTVAANVLEHGTGAINVDATRVGTAGGTRKGDEPTRESLGVYGDGINGGGVEPIDAGRWPPNLLLTHDPECGEQCADGCAVREIGEQSGERQSGERQSGDYGLMGYHGSGPRPMPAVGPSTGTAARFFPCFRYVAKPSTGEREAGLDHHDKRTAGELTDRADGTDGLNSPRAGAGRASEGRANTHPTVKPIALMQWLCRLLTPPGGTVLDPFCGSGTTGAAALREGFGFIGIELDETYAEIARSRIVGDAPLFNRVAR